MAKVLGRIGGHGEGGEVLQEADGLFIVGTSLTIDEDDEEVARPFRMGPFISLDALIAALPRGIRFLPDHEK